MEKGPRGAIRYINGAIAWNVADTPKSADPAKRTRNTHSNGAPVSTATTFAKSLDPEDLGAMLQWLMPDDDCESMPLASRQRRLLEGIASLINAAAWVWLVGVNADKADPVVVTILDGGWASDQERLEFFRAIGQSAQELISGVFGDNSKWPNVPLTCSSEECLSVARWRPNAKCSACVDAGFEHVLVSVRTLNAQSYSGVVFYRRLGEPPFGERERAIVHAMFQQVHWMHRSVIQAVELVSAIDISPRERGVLMRLLAGESCKTIAETLHVSPHTVADHLKQLYRKLGVKTRAGLMAKFIHASV